MEFCEISLTARLNLGKTGEESGVAGERRAGKSLFVLTHGR